MNKKTILITGGAGFIGSHVVDYFAKKYPKYSFVVMDCITYAGDDNFFRHLETNYDNVIGVRQDIRDASACEWIIKDLGIDGIIHLAAESHVDNSIENPNVFVETNVMGTLNLLKAAVNTWGENSPNRFHHVSTDEVYGDLQLDEAPFTELTPYAPSSPYSASKASSDHFVRAYGRTFGLNITISNCSNNYGPHQHAEKLIPVVINKLIKGEKIPVYGKGENVRDWLWVGDHVTAIDEIFHNGKSGHTYNVGGDNEMTNIDIIYKICEIFNNLFNNIESPIVSLPDFPIEFVTDRKGHDLRYAINSNKLQTNLNWKPEKNFEEGMFETIRYYVNKANG